MPWKQINNNKYLYRNVRQGNKIRSEYVGTGPAAELIASIEQAERRQRDVAAGRKNCSERDR